MIANHVKIEDARNVIHQLTNVLNALMVFIQNHLAKITMLIVQHAHLIANHVALVKMVKFYVMNVTMGFIQKTEFAVNVIHLVQHVHQRALVNHARMVTCLMECHHVKHNVLLIA